MWIILYVQHYNTIYNDVITRNLLAKRCLSRLLCNFMYTRTSTCRSICCQTNWSTATAIENVAHRPLIFGGGGFVSKNACEENKKKKNGFSMNCRTTLVCRITNVIIFFWYQNVEIFFVVVIFVVFFFFSDEFSTLRRTSIPPPSTHSAPLFKI